MTFDSDSSYMHSLQDVRCMQQQLGKLLKLENLILTK